MLKKGICIILISFLSITTCHQLQSSTHDIVRKLPSSWTESLPVINQTDEPSDEWSLDLDGECEWGCGEQAFEEETILDDSPDYSDDEFCFDDPHCLKNATHCDDYDGCCRFQTCYENGRCEIFRDCGQGNGGEQDSHTVYVEDPACFKNLYCFQNVTYCYYSDCCDYKTCYDDDSCSVIESTCMTPVMKGGPFIIDIREEEECFQDPDCKRDAHYCDREGCCFTKTCDSYGNCDLAGCW